MPESAGSAKIIHNCKMVSDALFHLIDITLKTRNCTKAQVNVPTSRRKMLNEKVSDQELRTKISPRLKYLEHRLPLLGCTPVDRTSYVGFQEFGPSCHRDPPRQHPSALHLPRLPEPPTHDLTYTRNARASTSPRSIGFCGIWGCTRSSSSSSLDPPGKTAILVLFSRIAAI